jgi:hypothetical protein
VRGSHGVPAESADNLPLLIGDGEAPGGDGPILMTAVRDLVLRALLGE